MKKIIFAFAVLLSMAACKQNKPTQAVENETETTALYDGQSQGRLQADDQER